MHRHTIDKRRIEVIDLARGGALVAMAIYHFAWDLEFFGYTEPGMTATGGWRLFARSIASSFLFLVGVSLYLAHARGFAWPSYLRRLALVAGAALAISIATFVAMPDAFIFFGILHQIALASVLGLLFLHIPVLVTVAVAAAIIAAPLFFRAQFFDHPLLWWIGLAPSNPRSNDYVPVFPWFATVLLGIAAAKAAKVSGLLERLREIDVTNWTLPLRIAGRHSLLVYLLHQPILIGAIWLFALVWPATPLSDETRFVGACHAQCADSRGEAFCSLYCACVLDVLMTEGRFEEVYTGRQSAGTTERLQEIVAQCSLDAEFPITGEDRR